MNMLGYVLFINVQYFVIPSGEYYANLKPIRTDRGLKMGGERRISPEKRGWLAVDWAVEQHQSFKRVRPGAPYVIAVFNHDTPNAMPFEKLREELGIGEDFKLVPCDPKNNEDAKRVFIELLEIVGTPAAERAREAIQSL